MNTSHPGYLSRRCLLATAAALGAAGLGVACTVPPEASTVTVGALFAGRIDDGGFMQAGYQGLERARVELGARTRHIEGVAPTREALEAALSELAATGVDLVVAHGGQNNEAAAAVAARFARTRFAVTQGAVTGANLSSYEVLQEQSAYLAGALAALVTRTGVVGHMSGIRVRPGLKGRAAYAAGVRDTDARVRLLTNFSGSQDDNALSRRIATAQIDAGADVIFTMLNAGRSGVTEVCRERGVRQIGNVVDWTRIVPEVFVASAIADVGIAVFQSVDDLRRGDWKAGVVRRIGLEDPRAVRLALGSRVTPETAASVDRLAQEVRAGRVAVPEDYHGAEFQTPT